jgi:hypothetical protein
MQSDHTNDLHELRAHLFATLRGLRDKTAPVSVEQARAVCAVAAELTATARIEIDYLRVAGSDGARPSGFLAAPPTDGGQAQSERQIQTGVVRVVQHRMGS